MLHTSGNRALTVGCLDCLCPVQEKDRAKFGPEYGDRFCMLQLVGRHEMDKVQLQHESESNPKLMVRWHWLRIAGLGPEGSPAAAAS